MCRDSNLARDFTVINTPVKTAEGEFEDSVYSNHIQTHTRSLIHTHCLQTDTGKPTQASTILHNLPTQGLLHSFTMAGLCGKIGSPTVCTYDDM